jgi:hypothetical protein
MLTDLIPIPEIIQDLSGSGPVSTKVKQNHNSKFDWSRNLVTEFNKLSKKA